VSKKNSEVPESKRGSNRGGFVFELSKTPFPPASRLFHKPQVRLDHRRYLTLSDSLGWDPEKFHEFSEAVQRVVQEMGVWFMG
jgi:hypothetical protein